MKAQLVGFAPRGCGLARRVRFLSLLLGLVALAGSSWATFEVRLFDAPPITGPARFSIDFDTGDFLATTNFTIVAGADLYIDTVTGGAPSTVTDSGATTMVLRQNFFPLNAYLLGAGVTVDASLPTHIADTEFSSFAYFAPLSAGTRYMAFQTSSDMDQNPLTTGTHFGFLQIEIGSMDVTGYGFGSEPGESVVTMVIPEPATAALTLLAGGLALAFRRRRTGV